MRRLTVERKNAIFKTLAISKILYLTLVANVATEIIINKPNEIQKNLFGALAISELNTPLYVRVMKTEA